NCSTNPHAPPLLNVKKPAFCGKTRETHTFSWQLLNVKSIFRKTRPTHTWNVLQYNPPIVTRGENNEERCPPPFLYRRRAARHGSACARPGTRAGSARPTRDRAGRVILHRANGRRRQHARRHS